MPNNVIRDKSRCAICSSDKSRFSKQRPNKNLIKSTIKKVVAIILILKVLYTKHYKPCWHCLKCKKDTDDVDSKMLKTKNGKLFFIIKMYCKC